MSTYKVTRLIRAAIRLPEPAAIDRVRFEPLEPHRSEQILVSGMAEASGYRPAVKLFDAHLLTVADAATVVLGAVVAPAGGSTMVEKRRSKFVFLHPVVRRPAAPLTIFPGYYERLLDGATTAAIELASNERLRSASHYLRQSATTEALTTAAFHALQAAEALSEHRGKTSHSRLRTVLGDELYGYFYRREPALGRSRRNALAHGSRIEEQDLQGVVVTMQELLVREVRQALGVSVDPAFTPVRGFVTYERAPRFLERRANPLHLPALVDAAAAGQLHSQSDPSWVGTTVSRRLWNRW